MVEFHFSLRATPPLLALCLFLVLVSFQISEAKIRHHKWAEAKIRRYEWTVRYENRSPDCFKKVVITVNGKSPGPIIEAEEGDTIVVDLQNQLLTENVVIHWHGIRQFGTPWSDGTEGVTQCPVQPGGKFRYQFVVDQPGTFLYHGHYGMQREAGLYGFIIVTPREPEPFSYDLDRSILLNDWFHQTTYAQTAEMSTIPFQWIGEPQSLLINGRGRFNCSSYPKLSAAVCNSSNPECTPFTQTVIPGKTYRLRIGSLASESSLSFQIEGHNMTVVEADSHYVEPFVVQNLFIYSGETYSVLVKTDQDPKRNYWMTSNVVSRFSASTPAGLAILNYYPNPPRRSPPTPPPPAAWNHVSPRLAQSLAIKALQGYVQKPPTTSDRVIVLLNTQNTINGLQCWALNNVSLTLPNTPYLVALKEQMTDALEQTPPPDSYDFNKYDIFSIPNNTNATSSNGGYYRLEFNSTVDVILQNANTLFPNNSATHPWHLHGHHFWVLGYGEGKFDMENDPKKYNLENPILKNTVPLHPFGWTALRFKANNPGVWIFHCHIESHFFMGMSVVFEEGVERVGKLPSSIMGCGKTISFDFHRSNSS